MKDYSERNLRIIQEAMQELNISDCEEIPEAIRQLKQKDVEPTLAVDDCPRCGGSGQVRNDGFVWVACPVCDGVS